MSPHRRGFLLCGVGSGACAPTKSQVPTILLEADHLPTPSLTLCQPLVCFVLVDQALTLGAQRCELLIDDGNPVHSAIDSLAGFLIEMESQFFFLLSAGVRETIG